VAGVSLLAMSPLLRSRRARTLGGLLAVVLALAGCSSALGGQGVGDPAPVTVSGKAPTGRPDPATSPVLARFYGQKLAWSSCGGGFECARVAAPIDWNRPATGTFQLAVVRLKATGKRLGSLLINPGGPGVSGVQWVRQDARSFDDALRSAYDLVGWDPRGSGNSAPVTCLSDRQLDAYYATDATPDDAGEVQTLVQEQKSFADACEANTGAILGHLDTISTVHDMDLLRAVLGDKVLSYYGGSYGTYLGAWYAQEFPWRVGRLVLDGAVDPSLTSAQYVAGQALGFSRAVRSYLQDCLSHDGCPLTGTVDDGMAQISALLAKADAMPLPTSSGRSLNQTLMAFGLAQGMYAQVLWPTVTRAITQAIRGDGTTLLLLADDYLKRDRNGHYAQDTTSYSPIYCLDHPETRTVAQIGDQAAQLEKQYPPLGGFIGWGETSCQGWPLPVVTPTQRLTAAGAQPILVVGTTDDPATPYEWAKSLASQLSSGRLLTRQGQGHAAYRQGSECIDLAIDRYLVEGKVPKAGTVCGA
jgi:pimeloyl-ACP methyl ester carboxylesterase